MVNRIHNAQESERNSHSFLDRHPSNRNHQNKPVSSDEIIVSLANTYENQRARQVNEWERVQAANVRRTT
ncbi:MAG: hypothetical protein ACJ72Z_07170 [Pyrinomonadaceae bacterium]